jgi:hypothetical protein
MMMEHVCNTCNAHAQKLQAALWVGTCWSAEFRLTSSPSTQQRQRLGNRNLTTQLRSYNTQQRPTAGIELFGHWGCNACWSAEFRLTSRSSPCAALALLASVLLRASETRPGRT